MKNSSRESGLAAKCSGFAASGNAEVGFVLSAAEMKKLGDLRDAMAQTSKAVNSSGRIVAAALGAVAMGLAFNAIQKSKERTKTVKFVEPYRSGTYRHQLTQRIPRETMRALLTKGAK